LDEPPELYLMLGLVYREAHEPHEAIRAFERAIAMKADSAQAHFYLGAQLEQLNRKPEARWELRRTIELDPNHADALNYLGYMDAESGTNLSEAKTLIERALALDPENGAYLDSLGWVYYKLGDLDAAIRYLERAATLVGDDPVVLDHLGEAYFKHGNVEKAQATWQKALELDQDVEAIKRKLESLMHREATVTIP
jgi:Tfp pilus assembly protein PilF